VDALQQISEARRGRSTAAKNAAVKRAYYLINEYQRVIASVAGSNTNGQCMSAVKPRQEARDALAAEEKRRRDPKALAAWIAKVSA